MEEEMNPPKKIVRKYIVTLDALSERGSRILDEAKDLCIKSANKSADEMGWDISEADFVESDVRLGDYENLPISFDPDTIIGGFIKYIWRDESALNWNHAYNFDANRKWKKKK